MSVTKIELKTPIKTTNGEVKTITLRRATVRDLKQAQRVADNPSDVDTWLVSILSEEKLTNEDVEGLDLADWAEVQAAFQSQL
jgi:hypothetical protein